MSTSILSQDEIEALLRKGKSSPQAEELQELLQFIAQNMTARMNRIPGAAIELEGPYVERLGKTIEQSVVDEFIVVAIDLGSSELLLLMSLADTSYLAERFQMTELESVQTLGKAWTSEMAELTGVSQRVYGAQSMSLSELRQMSLAPQSYLVRHLLTYSGQRMEFWFVMQQSEYLDTLVGAAMERVDITQAKEAAQGLLKGNKSKSPVTRAVFTPIDDAIQLEEDQNITLLEDIDLMVTVELGHTTLTLDQILGLEPQSVISLERQAGEPVDVYVNDTRSAKAEVVVLEENFGVRILEIIPKSKRF